MAKLKVNLNEEMTLLLGRFNQLAHEDPEVAVDMHCYLCQKLADEFSLWLTSLDGEESFPIWLSRVVEGWINDRSEFDRVRL